MICKVAATLRRHKTNHCKCVATVSAFVWFFGRSGQEQEPTVRKITDRGYELPGVMTKSRGPTEQVRATKL